MTKNELLATEYLVKAANGDASYIPLMAINEFFSQNVCIPKGENRHPYADVLHELVENSLLEYEVSQMNFISWGKGCMLHETAYRIKPSEPVYEWQWYRFHDGKLVICEHYKTEKEIKIYWNGHHQFAKPFEETKRVRQ